MAFRLSAHNWMRDEELDITLERLSNCGFWGIEIMGSPERPEYQDRAAMRAKLKKYKLECWGAVTLMLQKRDLIHADPVERRKSVEYVKACIDLINDLGGQVLTLVPSEVGKIVAMASPKEEWAWAVEGVKQCAEHALKKKVRIALEPLNRFETNFLNRGEQALELMKAVGSPDHVGVCLDAFHINIEEKDPLGAIKNVGKKLYDFHIADNNRRAPGDGNWDWTKLLKTLTDIGYDGCLTTEFVIPGDRTPATPELFNQTSDTSKMDPQLKFIIDHGGFPMTNEQYSVHFKRTIEHIRKCEPK